MGMTVKDIDRGWGRIVDASKALFGKELYVGYYEDQYPNGLPVALVAFWQEEGTSKMPAKKFMAKTLDINMKKYIRMRNRLWRSMLSGGVGPDEMYDELGKEVVADVKRMIVAIDLIRTGRLLRTTDYQVRES